MSCHLIHATDAQISNLEIYRIVSQKALDQGEGQAPIRPGQGIDLKSTQESSEAKKGGCC